MKKAILSIAVLSALSFSTISHAAPSLGPIGLITFAGGLNAESCTLQDAGAGGTGGTLNYIMGAVSSNALGTEANPRVASGSSTATTPIAMNLRLTCSGASSVELKLTPTTRIGQGIAVSGGATNVQIMLMQGTTALNFTSGSVTLTAPATAGVANIALNAYYTLQAGKTLSEVTPGPANGSASYILSYN